MKTGLLLFGIAMFLAPGICMWLDGFMAKDEDEDDAIGDELMIRWLMSKTPQQWDAIQASIVFGSLCMTVAVILK